MNIFMKVFVILFKKDKMYILFVMYKNDFLDFV